MALIIIMIIGLCCSLLGGKALYQAHSFDFDDVVVIENGMTVPENDGKYILAYGTITNEGKATDPLFEISVETPLLLRQSEMKQYIRPSSTAHGTPTIAFSADAEGGFEMDNGEHYSNPSFPSEYKSKVFYSDCITVSNGNLELSGEFVEPITYSSYIHFEGWEPIPKTNVTTLPECRVEDFKLEGSSYSKHLGRLHDIGDMNIYYTGYLASDLETREFSFFGKQENGKLVHDGIASCTFNKQITISELEDEMLETGNTGGIFALILGLVMFWIPLIIMLVLHAKDKKEIKN